jgi:hypothetical protein
MHRKATCLVMPVEIIFANYENSMDEMQNSSMLN